MPDASYWLYLVHIPLIMALQVLVAPLARPALVKFPVVLGVAFPLMLARPATSCWCATPSSAPS